MKITPKDGKYIHVFSNNETVFEYIKLVVPQNKRLFDASTSCWIVHNKYTLPLVQLGYAKVGYVDYSEMPEAIQVQIAGAKKDWTRPSRKGTLSTSHGDPKLTAYAILFLQPGAPFCVVKAAYKALSREYHPDCGGDEEKFKQITQAYEELNK